MDEYTTKDPKAFDKIERMAVRQRWPATSEKMEAAIERQFEIASSSESSNRESTSAFRAIVQAVGQNQKDEHELLKRYTEHRIAELDQVAKELCLDQSFIEAIDRESSLDS